MKLSLLKLRSLSVFVNNGFPIFSCRWKQIMKFFSVVCNFVKDLSVLIYIQYLAVYENSCCKILSVNSGRIVSSLGAGRLFVLI